MAEEAEINNRFPAGGSGPSRPSRDETRDAEPPVIGAVVSHYRVLELLGGGGMGEVYKAVDLRLERLVALKFLSARHGGSYDLKRRFHLEARAASRLEHPNICAIYETDETAAGRLFIVMALCSGEPLTSKIERGPLPLEQAVGIAAQVAAGLAAAHEKGVLHRDIKPANIMVADDGRAKIVDFGFARLGDQTRHTSVGDLLGTIAYMAPEQFLEQDPGHRADLWSLGVVLYEMVAGIPPFAAADQRDVIQAILERQAAPLSSRRPGVPPRLERIVARTLAKRPADRYQHAEELRADLAAVTAVTALAGQTVLHPAASAAGDERDDWRLPTREEGPAGAVPASRQRGESGASGASVPAAPAAETALAKGLCGRTISHYLIQELLGGGGMGIVYRAEDQVLARTVALKFLPPELSRDPDAKIRFLQEARSASALDHPYICTIHEVGETDEGQLFLAMAYYDGETLTKRLARGPLPIGTALNIAQQIARGLLEAHRHGIVHRDVKPANLMITAGDVVKILDFGIAKLAGAAGITRAGSPLGTPGYMSPEQASGGEVDLRTDLWSLGAVLYEMVAGRRPFRGEHEQAVLWALQNEEPEPLARLRPEAPPELERIVGRLLAKDPRQRYQDAGEVIADLQARSGIERRRDSLAQLPHTKATAASQVVVGRRQLTALCCDLLPAALGGEALDPEEVAELLDELGPELDQVCSQAVGRFDGHVVRRFAAGLLVYFGYPEAHEDDSRRAVRTALEIRAAVRQLSARFEEERQVRLAVRAGIHTGLVVGLLAGAEAEERLVQGEPPAVAEYLQSLAEADAVLVSEATQRLIAGFFDTERLGPVRLPASRQEQDAYRVLRDSGDETRFQVELRKGLTPIVGRGHEIALVLERWAEAREGRGQVVMISADAGIGKSRLLEEIRTRIGQEIGCSSVMVSSSWSTLLWIECRCSPYHRNSAFYPLIAMLAAWLRLDRESSPEEKLRRLESSLEQSAVAREQVPLLASLLSIPFEEHYPALGLEPRERRQRTIDVVAGMVLEASLRQPVVLAVEDVHLADPSTLDWLDLVIEQVSPLPVLALLAFRPEFSPPPAWRTHASQIALSRLHHEQVAEMIGQITGGKALPHEVAEEVFRKTEGVPLFVEDLTRMVVESGLVEERDGAYVLNGPFRPLAIPDTLQEALMARLERLDTARAVAELGATIGREFLFEMLREVAELDDLTLTRELDRLVAAGLLYRRGLLRPATYVWKHALVQEALVHSLLKRQRRRYHKLIAEALERSFPEIAASQPELVAHHWTEAGQLEPAVDSWLKATQHALQVSANVEAVRHASRGLELLARLPESRERDQRELLLHTAQGPALLALKGWASPEYGAFINRALALSQGGDAPELFEAQIRRAQNLMVGARLAEAHYIGMELLRIAETARNEDFLLEVHALLCVILCYLGDPAACCEQARQGLAIYDLDRHHGPHALLYGLDPAAVYATSAVHLWQLGDCDQSLALSLEGLRLADAFSHAFSRGFVLCGVAWNFLQRRDAAGAAQASARVIEVARAHDFANLLAWGTTLRGAALAAQGEVEEGIGMIRRGSADWQASGAAINGCYFPCLLAEAQLAAGRPDEARSTLELALEAAPRHEDRCWWSEVHRLKGDLLRRGGAPVSEAESWLEGSLEIARRQRARSLELRSAMSLARLRCERGQRLEAHRLLAEIYGAFSEGLDTPDLVDARALLAELS
ncbi:MAG TPA: protein kinase [Thermoanaerobaculia bacterium]|nr:protein kinase [Thermoanaerobaculia bacterium]